MSPKTSNITSLSSSADKLQTGPVDGVLRVASLSPPDVAITKSMAIRQRSSASQHPLDTPLWQQALECLNPEDRRYLPAALTLSSGSDEVSLLIRLLNNKLEDSDSSQWTFKRRDGRQVSVRQVIEKVAGWLNRFKEMGDQVVQYDPGHAALPWALVRFVLEIAVADVEKYGVMLEGLEYICGIVTCSAEMEYQDLGSASKHHEHLRASLVKLYTTTLRFLGRAYTYFNQSSTERVFKSALQSNKQSMEMLLLDVKEQEARVYTLINFVRGRGLEAKVDSLFGLIQDSDKFRTEKRRQLVQWLKPVNTDDLLDNSLRRRHPLTCDWFLQTKDFQQWLRPSKASKLLWVHGPAAFGKTILSARVVDSLKHELSRSIAYFFCAFENAMTQDPYQALRSWIAQIIQQEQEAVDAAILIYQKHSDRSPTKSELWDLFQQIAAACPSIFLAIDGFDECSHVDPYSKFQTGGHRALFLEELMHNLSKTSVRLLLTSRDEPDIRASIDSVRHSSMVHIHDFLITSENNRQDILEVSKGIVEKRLPNKSSDVKNELADLAAKKSDGMFLMLDLMANSMKPGKNSKALLASVTDMPAGIEAAYKRDLERLAHMEDSEKEHAVAMLRWILFASRPLTVLELIEATAVAEPRQEIYPWDELPGQWRDIDSTELTEEEINSLVREPCGSLIEIRKQKDSSLMNATIHFVHYSVREYLLKPKSSHLSGQLEQGISYLDPSGDNDFLAQLCLKYLSFEDIDVGYGGVEQLQGQLKQFPFLEYASNYWLTHVSRVGSCSESLVESAFEFGDVESSKWARTIAIRVLTGEKGDLASDLKIVEDDLIIPSKVISPSPDEAERDSASSEQPKDASMVDLIMKTESFKELGSAPGILAYLSYRGVGNLVGSFCARGTDVNAVGGLYDNALEAAIAAGHFDIADDLLANGADASRVGGHYGCALNAAAVQGSLQMVKRLHECGASLVVASEEGKTAIGFACLSGSTELVRYLIDEGAQVHHRDRTGLSPLYAACQAGNAEVIKMLLEHGAEIEETGGQYQGPADFPLNVAIFNDHLEAVKLLVEHDADPTTRNKDGWTCLHAASRFASVPLIEYLLLHGCQDLVNDDKFPENAPPLSNACLRPSPDHTVVQLLLDHGADVNWSAPADGCTALYKAIATPHTLQNHSDDQETSIISILLSHGADPNKEWSFSQTVFTPLMCAAAVGNPRAIELLLSYTSDLEKQDPNYGYTALHRAVSEGHTDATAALLAHGANPNAKTFPGISAVHMACIGHNNGSEEVLQLLINAGADIHEPLPDGPQILWLVAQVGKPEVAACLLEHGADVNAEAGKGVVDAQRGTALMGAAREGSEEMVGVLLRYGADVERRDMQGKSALELARDGGFEGVVELLVDHGAKD